MSIWYHDFEPLYGMYDMDHILNRASLNVPSGDASSQQKHNAANSTTSTLGKITRGWQPKMDIHENTDSNFVTAMIELPGLKKEDISIDLRQNRLMISGETKFHKEVNEHGYVHRERQTGKFFRAIPIPAGLKPEQIKASMEQGVLSLTFPKASPEQPSTKIAIT